jgi:hypothetical protein
LVTNEKRAAFRHFSIGASDLGVWIPLLLVVGLAAVVTGVAINELASETST